jgi:hypothetical protein
MDSLASPRSALRSRKYRPGGETVMHGLFANKPALLAAVGLGVVFLFIFSWGPAKATSSGPSSTGLAKNDESSQEASPDFSFLKGRWRRPDGGYVIDIKDVDFTGKMDAAYFNPNPIHVAKAEATGEAGATTLFIELRDAGYPGCTYTLTYDPQTGQLRGVYFQAAMQQKFDVVFFRIK